MNHVKLICLFMIRYLANKAIYDVSSTLNSKTDTRVPYFYQLCYWQHFKCPPFLKSYFTLLHANVFASQTPTFPTIKPIKIYTFRTLRSRSYEKPRQTVLESSRETYNCFYLQHWTVIVNVVFSMTVYIMKWYIVFHNTPAEGRNCMNFLKLN